jgi:hypothetical protein
MQLAVALQARYYQDIAETWATFGPDGNHLQQPHMIGVVLLRVRVEALPKDAPVSLTACT